MTSMGRCWDSVTCAVTCVPGSSRNGAPFGVDQANPETVEASGFKLTSASRGGPFLVSTSAMLGLATRALTAAEDSGVSETLAIFPRTAPKAADGAVATVTFTDIPGARPAPSLGGTKKKNQVSFPVRTGGGKGCTR